MLGCCVYSCTMTEVIFLPNGDMEKIFLFSIFRGNERSKQHRIESTFSRIFSSMRNPHIKAFWFFFLFAFFDIFIVFFLTNYSLMLDYIFRLLAYLALSMNGEDILKFFFFVFAEVCVCIWMVVVGIDILNPHSTKALINFRGLKLFLISFKYNFFFPFFLFCCCCCFYGSPTVIPN